MSFPLACQGSIGRVFLFSLTGTRSGAARLMRSNWGNDLEDLRRSLPIRRELPPTDHSHISVSAPMDSRTPLEMLLDLDSRHDELLDRLADLDKQVKNVLAQCQEPAAKMPPLQGGPPPVDTAKAPAAALGVIQPAAAAAPTLDGLL